MEDKKNKNRLWSGPMIREISNNDLEQCANLIKEFNTGANSMRYFPNTDIEIHERIFSRIKSKNHNILVIENKTVITTFLEYFIESDERYIQLLAFFTQQDYVSSFDQILNYLKEKYNGYSLDYVVNDFNLNAIDYMKSVGASCNGIESMIHINKNDFIGSNSNKVIELNEEYYEQFIKMHDSKFPEVYWKGELLIFEKEKFKKYVILDRKIIKGYAVLSCFKRKEEEIYFLFSNEIEMKLQLISKSLEIAFKSAETVQILLTSKEKKDIAFFLELGFTEKERLYTLSLLL